jgi:hypothetical protein
MVSNAIHMDMFKLQWWKTYEYINDSWSTALKEDQW